MLVREPRMVAAAACALIAAYLLATPDRAQSPDLGSAHARPSPRQEPIQISPRVGAIADIPADLLGPLESGMTLGAGAKVSELVHDLYRRGGNATIVPKEGQGAVPIVDLLLDVPSGSHFFGGSETLFRTQAGARFNLHEVLLKGTNQQGTEAHAGQVLSVLGLAGVPSGRPIRLADGTTGSVAWLLDDLEAGFLPAGEIYWEAMALALYLPPRRSWRNRFGEEYTFDVLARELLARPLEESACAGTHRLITLAVLMRADEVHPVLSEAVRGDLRGHLAEMAARLAAKQHPEGGWGMDWYESDSSHAAAEIRDPRAIIIPTGHHLEWLMLMPEDSRPPDRDLARAAERLVRLTAGEAGRDPRWLRENYCPATHAVRSARILARPAEGPRGPS